MQNKVLEIFNSIVIDVVEAYSPSSYDYSMLDHGVVTDFKISPTIREVIRAAHTPLPINTLFSRVERLASSPYELIQKQLLHYIEVYGLDTPGLFNLEVCEGVVLKPTFIKGISKAELHNKIGDILYRNAPVKDAQAIADIINHWLIPFDFDLIENNELRVLLYNPRIHKFRNGDDAIRYLVWKTTDSPLVIKSSRVIDQIKHSGMNTDLQPFLERNAVVLSQVFNRFKPILLAVKKGNETIINQISRMSKIHHKPVHEAISKRFLSVALNAIQEKKLDNILGLLNKLSNRDIFKILNLIEYKKIGYDTDVFVIRNGSIHTETNRTKLNKKDLSLISSILLAELKDRLQHLADKTILLDSRVDYGLPVSRKQTIGNLPFGTTVTLDKISSGIYWENSWGGRDLDLSTVDLEGRRTGWGYRSGYDNSTGIVYSGDLTDATNGAMEFMTNMNNHVDPYGLFVNIYYGDEKSGYELIIGNSTDTKWMDEVVIREKSNLVGRGSVIGFVRGNQYTVYQGKLSNRIANFGERSPVLNKATAPMWTMKKLFDSIGLQYDTEKKHDRYDYSLEYVDFSLDKLEDLLYT